MAKDFNTQAATQDQSVLIEEAANIYRQLVAQRPGIELGQLAKEAFALAQPFAQEAARILAGGKVEAPKQEERAPMVLVWMWDDVTQKPLYDENTGKPIVQELPGDPSAHAPKLNPAHPINQRYWLALKSLERKIPKMYEAAFREYEAAILSKG